MECFACGMTSRDPPVSAVTADLWTTPTTTDSVAAKLRGDDPGSGRPGYEQHGCWENRKKHRGKQKPKLSSWLKLLAVSALASTFSAQVPTLPVQSTGCP